MKKSSLLTGWMFLAMALSARAEPPLQTAADVCVYAATPGGILAAIAVKREGHSVVLVEPSRWVGGMLGAGLKPLQDCPNYVATGGLTHELLPLLGRSQGSVRENDVRALSPEAIRQDFLQLLADHEIRVLYEHRIARCEVRDCAIAKALFDLAPFDELGCPVAAPAARDHLTVTAKVFIDASYEGDLMAAAGVGYRVGREAADEFDEPYAGVQSPMELAPIDPFVEPGRADSGLLAWVENDHGKPVGSADNYTQAYNYRYYTTSDPAVRIPFTVPENYDAAEFELVGRYVEHLVATIDDPKRLRERLVGIFPGWMNSGEWNYQRKSLFSMAPLGISQHYAAGDYAAKARVWKQHQDYLRGLQRFMSTDARVPEAYRAEVANIGLDGRFHRHTQGWPHQLYIRVARRLRGRYTITAHDVYNKTTIDDPIGLAQYGIDTYPSRRIWLQSEGQTFVGIEGKMFIGGNRGPTNVPYPIPYRAITPQVEECTNLLVPVCFSATHLGYASARMEPVFMICGESAGIAACRALKENVSVQQIDADDFAQALRDAGQKLTWDVEKDRSLSRPSKYTFAGLLGECDRDDDGFVSQSEWEAGKPGWEWLYPHVDSNRDGKIVATEYAAFQQYKGEHADWTTRLRGVQE
ncbi:MAG: FAD-dependent oxidoreductase [Planctomycetales bacterium]|nr:FAD-dependent oxidoreductase [Planctomycetales bacterium]